jgi:hypothetical protein
MKMVPELHRARQRSAQRWNAGAAAFVVVHPGRSFALHFASRSVPTSNESAHVAFGRAASFAAQLRSASCRRELCHPLQFITCRRPRSSGLVRSGPRHVPFVGSPTMPSTRRAKTHARYGCRWTAGAGRG